MDEVSTAVDNGSVNLPTGILWGTDKAYAVQSNGQLDNAAEFGALIVAYRDGAPVRLRDLGRVIDSVQDTKQASWFNGQRAIVLAIQRQPGTNTVAVVAAGQGGGREVPAEPSALGRARDAVRPLAVDRAVGERRQVHPVPGAVPRGDGDLPVPSEHSRDR